MISRREMLIASMALSSALGPGSWGRAFAQQRLTENDLLDAPAFGDLTIAHITDIHAQLKPVWFREPSVNIGVGAVRGLPPHVVGDAFLKLYGIEPGSPQAYALACSDFEALAKTYGRMGGLDRVATVLKRLRAQRPDGVLLLDGGDTWQGSYTAQATQGQDMIEVMNLLAPDAMTGHWEFTYGQDRVQEMVDALPFPFLGANIFDTDWDEPAFEAWRMFERGGHAVAVIGQAFPYTPIANPRWMFPGWSFGIREERVAEVVQEARDDGAEVVVLLSHNGFDVDRKLASRVDGIDVILTGHTHDALPEPWQVNDTLLLASGSNGKFVGALDLEVRDGKVSGFRHRLIPVFSDIISPDAEVAAKIDEVRAPYEAALGRKLAEAGSVLFRRGNFNGTLDDVFCQALIAERDAQISLSPGFRWGPSLVPGQAITVEDLHNACAMSYPAAYRAAMSGETIKTILEDVADNLFNPDPYYQQGGDMVRMGGMGYAIDPGAASGARISDMTLLETGETIAPDKTYVVAGWASVNEDTEGPAIWDVVEAHLQKNPVIDIQPTDAVRVIGDYPKGRQA